ncbi:hypothetical protein NQ315_006589 [Exocentrus adspersus]|uniref:DDE-1 domain-containing protein n=1 Tax=Exocentrus adspersus TaxID=1586481 RepID=A0AAV8VG07_9CUCU|nr:hypothetical protein NQ315_006589 [Exocentrus adspersus]
MGRKDIIRCIVMQCFVKKGSQSKVYQCQYCSKKYALNVTRMSNHLLTTCKQCPKKLKKDIYQKTKSSRTTSGTSMSKMPRKKKTNKIIGRFSENNMREAVQLVVQQNYSLRAAAKQKNVSFQTLSRYVQKYKRDDNSRMCPNTKLIRYFLNNTKSPCIIVICSKMFYGLTFECFVQVIKHFIKHTNALKENPALLIMDNHESHLSIEVINLCKDNGITILTIPPHCTNKLQPLDVGVLKPFQIGLGILQNLAFEYSFKHEFEYSNYPSN